MKTSLLGAISASLLISMLVGTAGAANKSGEKFRADLTGDAEVPTVMTDTSGDFRLAYDDFDGTAIYRIRLRDGLRVFMAHIHCGLAGANGPIVVWLAGNPGEDRAWDVDGKWIDNSTFTGTPLNVALPLSSSITSSSVSALTLAPGCRAATPS